MLLRTFFLGIFFAISVFGISLNQNRTFLFGDILEPLCLLNQSEGLDKNRTQIVQLFRKWEQFSTQSILATNPKASIGDVRKALVCFPGPELNISIGSDLLPVYPSCETLKDTAKQVMGEARDFVRLASSGGGGGGLGGGESLKTLKLSLISRAQNLKDYLPNDTGVYQNLTALLDLLKNVNLTQSGKNMDEVKPAQDWSCSSIIALISKVSENDTTTVGSFLCESYGVCSFSSLNSSLASNITSNYTGLIQNCFGAYLNLPETSIDQIYNQVANMTLSDFNKILKDPRAAMRLLNLQDSTFTRSPRDRRTVEPNMPKPPTLAICQDDVFNISSSLFTKICNLPNEKLSVLVGSLQDLCNNNHTDTSPIMLSSLANTIGLSLTQKEQYEMLQLIENREDICEKLSGKLEPPNDATFESNDTSLIDLLESTKLAPGAQIHQKMDKNETLGALWNSTKNSSWMDKKGFDKNAQIPGIDKALFLSNSNRNLTSLNFDKYNQNCSNILALISNIPENDTTTVGSFLCESYGVCDSSSLNSSSSMTTNITSNYTSLIQNCFGAYLNLPEISIDQIYNQVSNMTLSDLKKFLKDPTAGLKLLNFQDAAFTRSPRDRRTVEPKMPKPTILAICQDDVFNISSSLLTKICNLPSGKLSILAGSLQDLCNKNQTDISPIMLASLAKTIGLSLTQKEQDEMLQLIENKDDICEKLSGKLEPPNDAIFESNDTSLIDLLESTKLSPGAQIYQKMDKNETLGALWNSTKNSSWMDKKGFDKNAQIPGINKALFMENSSRNLTSLTFDKYNQNCSSILALISKIPENDTTTVGSFLCESYGVCNVSLLSSNSNMTTNITSNYTSLIQNCFGPYLNLPESSIDQIYNQVANMTLADLRNILKDPRAAMRLLNLQDSEFTRSQRDRRTVEPKMPMPSISSICQDDICNISSSLLTKICNLPNQKLSVLVGSLQDLCSKNQTDISPVMLASLAKTIGLSLTQKEQEEVLQLIENKDDICEILSGKVERPNDDKSESNDTSLIDFLESTKLAPGAEFHQKMDKNETVGATWNSTNNSSWINEVGLDKNLTNYNQNTSAVQMPGNDKAVLSSFLNMSHFNLTSLNINSIKNNQNCSSLLALLSKVPENDSTTVGSLLCESYGVCNISSLNSNSNMTSNYTSIIQNCFGISINLTEIPIDQIYNQFSNMTLTDLKKIMKDPQSLNSTAFCQSAIVNSSSVLTKICNLPSEKLSILVGSLQDLCSKNQTDISPIMLASLAKTIGLSLTQSEQNEMLQLFENKDFICEMFPDDSNLTSSKISSLLLNLNLVSNKTSLSNLLPLASELSQSLVTHGTTGTSAPSLNLTASPDQINLAKSLISNSTIPNAAKTALANLNLSSSSSSLLSSLFG